MPVVPIRNALLAAGAVAPFQLARPSSIAAVNAAKDGVIAMFAQKDDANEAPRADDLHAVGCAVRVAKSLPAEGGGIWIVVRAAQWIHLDALESTSPYLSARVSNFAILQTSSEKIVRLHGVLKEHVRASLKAMPDGERMISMTDGMTPLALADSTIANLPCAVGDKAHYASLPELEARLEMALALIQKMRS